LPSTVEEVKRGFAKADLLDFADDPENEVFLVYPKMFLGKDFQPCLADARAMGGDWHPELSPKVFVIPYSVAQAPKSPPNPSRPSTSEGRRGPVAPLPGAGVFTPASELPTRHDGKVDLEAVGGLKPLAQDEVLWVELGKLKPNRYNPNEMSEEEFQPLLENMRKEGPNGTDPLLIRPLGADDWEIIDGFHRYKAAGVLAWPKIRCMVRRVDEDRAQEINYAKNKLRGSINPWKEAELFEASRKKGLTQEAIAKKFGLSSRQYVESTLSLLRVSPTVRQFAPRGANRSLLELLARVDDPVKQTILAKRITHPQGCTVREAEQLLNTLEQYPSEPSPTATPTSVPTGKPPEVPPKPPATEKTGPYWCPQCKRNRDDRDVRKDWRGIVCMMCGSVVEVVKPAEVVLVGTTEHYGKTTVALTDIVKVKAILRPPNVEPPGVDWRVEYRDSGVVMSKPITEACGLELEKLGVHIDHIEVAPPTPPSKAPPAPPATPTPTVASTGEPTLPTSRAKPKEIDLDAIHKFCPICGDPMTVTAYERLKKKFESVTETVASLFKGTA